MVAETLTRGKLTVRIERVGRPEVKNLMLAPKQFDQVNRDLEIRDLYNMEDAFHLADGYEGAYRARLNANLAFWDGLDGKTDWPADGDGTPSADRARARRLPRRRRHASRTPSRARSSRSSCAARDGARARDVRRTGAQRRRHGHALHAADQRRATGPVDPRRRRPVDAGRPRATFPYLSPPNPDPPEPPEHH